MSYDSKHSGAVAEQMLDDYVGGKLGGEGGAKVYHFDLNTAVQVGAIGQEIYDAILAADIVMVNGIVAYKEVVEEDGSIRLYSSVTANSNLDDPSQLTSIAIGCIIGADLSVTAQLGQALIPTKTSQLTNDSNFITAADIPPSGGLPTEVIEPSSEITLQAGKMLEIDLATPVTGALALRNPTITDATQGLLSGIRFYCGESLPQLSFTGLFGFSGIWANGELPQLEPNSVIEILTVRATGGSLFLLTGAIYKA